VWNRVDNCGRDTTLHIDFLSTCLCSLSYLQDHRPIAHHPSISKFPFPPLPLSHGPCSSSKPPKSHRGSTKAPINSIPPPLHSPKPKRFPSTSPTRTLSPPLNPRPFDSTPRAINSAYATVISKDDYLPGALVPEKALRAVSKPAYLMLRCILVLSVQSNS